MACRWHFPFGDKELLQKCQICAITFILLDCITQTERAMNNNNNKDTIKVKYLTLARLTAEYSNLLIIIAGCAALNQQLPWEHA